MKQRTKRIIGILAMAAICVIGVIYGWAIYTLYTWDFYG